MVGILRTDALVDHADHGVATSRSVKSAG
jgi:hypothetical protein